MSSAVATANGVTAGEIMEQVLAAGDLSKLSPGDRAHYVVRVAESVGLNPLTKPFDLITLNGRLTLYTTKTATDQLRALRGIELRIVDEKRVEDVWQVTVEARDPNGRTDTDIGAVTIGNLKGDALANALMKAVTKAKRRVTLSICGLGMLDESELDTIPRERIQRSAPEPVVAELVEVEAIDAGTGEIETLESVKLDIKQYAEELGFSGDDVKNVAKESNANYRTLAGAQQLRSILLEMTEQRAEGDAGDDSWTD